MSRPPPDPAAPARGPLAALHWSLRAAAYRRRRIVMPVLGALLVALSLADHAGLFGRRGDDRWRYHNVPAAVVAVLDRALLDVDRPDGRAPRTRVRLLGLSAETPADALRPELEGRIVHLELDPAGPTRDADGRLLAYVRLPGAPTCFNEVALARGLARMDRQSKHVLRARFEQVQRAARAAGLGLWSESETKPRQPRAEARPYFASTPPRRI